MEGSDAVVNVTSNGRRASRRLSTPEELVHTVRALMILPPEFEPPHTISPSERPPAEVALPVVVDETTRVEVAVGAAVRVGGNLYAGAGFSALADVVVHDYVLGISGRWNAADAYIAKPTAGDFSMESGALGVVLGRRAPTHWANIDALLDGQIVLETQDQEGPGNGVGGDSLDTRLGLSVRASTPSPKGLRFFLSTDVEASPARTLHPKRLDRALPLLPAWTCGLALGVLWGPQ
jgi:hypothetical protein